MRGYRPLRCPTCSKLLAVRDAYTGAYVIQRAGRRVAALYAGLLYCPRCEGIAVEVTQPPERVPSA